MKNNPTKVLETLLATLEEQRMRIEDAQTRLKAELMKSSTV